MTRASRRSGLVSDEPDKYSPAEMAPGTQFRHRDYLDEVQRHLREVEGATAIIYDQTCAAEKRRRRKRGTMVDPDRRVFINPLVCEGCGDCSVQSNCIAIEPLETEFGRKRQINQSSCNKDFSCVKGFCPSFVTIEGGKSAQAPAACRNIRAKHCRRPRSPRSTTSTTSPSPASAAPAC